MRAVIFANGTLSDPHQARRFPQPGDLLLAADGGARHCQELGLTPDILIGDLDSTDPALLAHFQAAGTEVIRFPARKDFTDLELAIRHAAALGRQEIYILAALGARWDQTLANLLLPAAADLAGLRISLLDGPQEILLLRAAPGDEHPSRLQLRGRPGDTVSLIPLGGDALGVTTAGLEYPLDNGRLPFGATLGISNVLTAAEGSVALAEGILLCVIIHQGDGD